MGSPLKVLHAMCILSIVIPGINAAPAGAKLELEAFKNVEERVYKRQDAGGLIDTCNLCPVIRRLSSYLPEDVQDAADNVNDQLRNLIAAIGPQLPGGIPALDSLLDTLPGGLPTDILGGGLPGIGGIPPILSPGVGGLTDVLPLPTDLLGSGLPTDVLDNLPLPTDILGGLTDSLPLPTNLANLPVTGILGGLADGLPVVTDLLDGSLPTVFPGSPSLTTDILGGLPSNILSGLLTGVLDALPTNTIGSLPLDALTALPTGVFEVLPTNVLGALPTGVLDALPTGISDVLPTDILGGLASGLPTNGLPALPTDIVPSLPTDILGGLASGLPALPTDIIPGLPTNILGGLTSDLPTDILSGLPVAVPTGIADILPSGLLGGLPGVVPTNVATGPAPIPTNVGTGLLGGLPVVSGLLGGLGLGNLASGLPAVPTPTGLLGGLGGLGALTNLASALPTPTGFLGPVKPPRTTVPRIIQSGTVVDKAYNWSFYNNGAVQVEKNFLFPRQGVLSGLLPDRTFSGLFADGLHIGDHVIPYPAGYLPLLTGIRLPLLPPSLLNLVPDDDAGDSSKK